jgi:hypothetical protein
MQLFRRATVPDAVKAVPLPPGERRIAWALTTQGQPVVASSRGLYLPGVPPLPWDGIERVHWDQPLLSVLELTERAGSGQRHHVELDLAHDTDLPETVRTRVTASVAWSTHVKLQPAGGVRVVGRRRPGMEVLDWQLVFDADTDPEAPGLRAQAEEHLAAARRTIG